jgi:spore coat polysaccharide biosynthesis protein SpsF
MGSTRLPGKILKKVLNKSLLEYQIERVRRAKSIDQIVIATTTKEADDQIVEEANRLSLSFYRGQEENVLDRYYHTAKEYEADIVVRLTSDCPVIDPFIIDKVIDVLLKNRSNYDYVSNTLERTYPRGMDTEVFTYQSLREAYKNADNQIYKEHVTTYIYNHPQHFRLGRVINHEDNSHYRWTVDTPEDFELIKKIIEELYPQNPHFSIDDILDLLAVHPDWNKINSFIEQKKS